MIDLFTILWSPVGLLVMLLLGFAFFDLLLSFWPWVMLGLDAVLSFKWPWKKSPHPYDTSPELTVTSSVGLHDTKTIKLHVPDLIPYRRHFILKEHLNGNQEIVDEKDKLCKIKFAGTNDIIYMKDSAVIAVKPGDQNGRLLKYTEDSLLLIDSIQFPALTLEAESYLNRVRNFQR